MNKKSDRLASLKRLEEVKVLKDIIPLASTTYPGTHCPLFGAAITLRMLENTVMLVVGTEECTYYTKSTSMVYKEFGGLEGRCVSLVMNHHDVTFGCREKLEEAGREIIEEYEPEAVFVVTTCIPELIGDDLESVAESLWEKYDIPFLTVHTEHFRCDSHLSGIQNVFSACVAMMEKQEQTLSINILGSQSQSNEMTQILEEAGVTINMCLPAQMPISQVKCATRAKLNIVCAKNTLLMAKEMEKAFDIPYICFYDCLDADTIYRRYKRIFEILDQPMPESLEMRKRALQQASEEAKRVLQGVSYILGFSSVEPFILTQFLSNLGMEIQMLQLKEIDDENLKVAEMILELGQNPYVTRSANLAALQDIYGILQPDIYLGPAERHVLLQHGIIGAGIPKGTKAIGFELAQHIIEMFSQAAEKGQKLKENKNEHM